MDSEIGSGLVREWEDMREREREREKKRERENYIHGDSETEKHR